LVGKQKRRIPMNCKRSISIIIVVGVLGTCLIAISAMGQAKVRTGMALREEMVAAVLPEG
jgi:hypothetical protein